jgi:hypothetical protein
MTTTKTIAGLIGPLLAAVGLALVARPSQFAAMAGGIADDPALLFMSGAIILVAGVAIVRAHNVWVLGWPAIVTVFGWLAILGGLTRLFFPRELATLASDMMTNTTVLVAGGVVGLALGGFLTFMSFRARS